MYNKSQDQDNDCISDLLKYKNVGFVIQPFRAEIHQGEISVVATNGNIRYAIKRFPGILSSKLEPEYMDINEIPGLVLEQTQLLLEFLTKKYNIPPKLCRIDFVKNDIIFEIMEVELIDPDLFFRHIPKNILDQSLSDICDTGMNNNYNV